MSGARPVVAKRRRRRGGQSVAAGAVLKTIWPGQAGAIKLGQRFGDALVCVRYRSTAGGERRRTTVELVVEEAPVGSRRLKVNLPREQDTKALRAQAIQLGAEWDSLRRVWIMPNHVARELGIGSHRRKPRR